MILSDAIDYPQRLENALLWMVGELLRQVAADGLPGEHHFYLTFRTDAEGVEMPASLRESFPEEMTIVLQHRFWDLTVEDDRFGVTLAFDGARQRLRVPFAALRAFLDPSVRFGLRFGPGSGEGEDDEPLEGDESAEAPDLSGTAEGTGEANVISFDRFRKR